MTSPSDATKAARIAGRALQPILRRLLACIAEVEADGWDTDWVRLPRRHASAVLTDIEAGLIDRTTARDAAHRVELLGSELALRRWITDDGKATEFDAIAAELLDPLSKYRGYLRALSSVEAPQENDMRRYELVSGAFFSLLTLVQLTRVVMGWPVQVGAVNIPVWASVLAGLVAGSLAVWAFRSSRDATS